MPKTDEDIYYKSKVPRKQIQGDLLPKYLPSAYTEVTKLYTMHFCFAFVSRMWDMGIVFLIAEITNNSLFLVAICGFLGSLFVFLFMPIVGSYLDKVNRMVAVQRCLAVKLTIVSLAYVFCAYLCEHKTATPYHKVILYAIPFLSALAGISFATITQSIEKDWIVVLSDGDSAWLSNTNSVMSQIDLACASFAPAITGFLFSYFSSGAVAAMLLGFNAVVTVCLFLFMRGLYHSWSALSVRNVKAKDTISSNGNGSAGASSDANTSDAASLPWSARCLYFLNDFLTCGCAGVMISYAFLYLTVLSFGSIMTVYLLWVGLEPKWIGIFRGMNCITGFTGALLFPHINKKFGLYPTSQGAIVWQCSLVLFAASSFFWAEVHVSVMILVTAVLLSRAGLWTFDLGVRQIAQETIHESVRGKVNGQWKSMTAFFEMTGYFAAILLSNAKDFWILACISAFMVTSSMVLFTLSNPFSGFSYVSSLSASSTSKQQYNSVSTSENVPINKPVDAVELEMRNTRIKAYGADDE